MAYSLPMAAGLRLRRSEVLCNSRVFPPSRDDDLLQIGKIKSGEMGLLLTTASIDYFMLPLVFIMSDKGSDL